VHPDSAQERQTRAFGAHARALAEWDRHIFRNRRTLSALEAEMKRVAGAQDALERQLSILEVHQAEIHSALESMQREAEQLYEKEGPRPDDASRERDALFAVAEDVSRQLTDIGLTLRDTIHIVRPLPAARMLPPDSACAGQLAGGGVGPGVGPALCRRRNHQQPALLSRCVNYLGHRRLSCSRPARSPSVWIDTQASSLRSRCAALDGA